MVAIWCAIVDTRQPVYYLKLVVIIVDKTVPFPTKSTSLIRDIGNADHFSQRYLISPTLLPRYAPAKRGHKHGMLAVGVASIYTLLPLSVVTCLYAVILREAREHARRGRRRGDHNINNPFWRAPLTVSIVVGKDWEVS
jgi:hypothetical protein